MDRNKLISILQVYGILLVVLGHCFALINPKPLLFHWIYSFHMPLFIFISGYLFQFTQQRKNQDINDLPWWGRKGLLWKKFKRLLVPYIFISSITFIPKGLMSAFAIRPTELSVSSYFEMLCYPFQNVIALYWFIPTLFVVFILARLMYSFLKAGHSNLHAFVILSIALAIHLYNPLQNTDDSISRFFNIAGALSYFLYFTAGIYCCQWGLVKKHLHPTLPNVALSAVLSLAFVTVIPDFTGKDILAAGNGIALSIMLCKIYEKRNWTFLNHLFGSSYAIFLFSWFPQTASQQVFISLTHAPLWTGSVLAMVSGVYIPWLIYKVIMHYRPTRTGKVVAFLCGH